MNILFRFRILIICFLLTGNAVAQTEHPKIIDHLMDEARISRPRGTNQVDTIMLHFSSDASARPTDPYNVDRVIATYGNAASAHYLIDREGNIYRLVKEQRIAWHAGKGRLPWPPYRSNMNSTSIGIEMMNISTWDDMKIFIPKTTYDKIAKKDIGYTDAQYQSLNQLLKDIRSRWPLVPFDRHHIISHSDYAPGRRTDPGVLFDWTKIGLPATMPKD